MDQQAYAMLGRLSWYESMFSKMLMGNIHQEKTYTKSSPWESEPTYPDLEVLIL